MNKIQTTLATATLALGATFGSTALAQDDAVSAERTQVTQDIIACIENDVELDIDSAFESASAANRLVDVHKYMRANMMNTMMDCTAPHVGLEVTEDLRADENTGGLELLALFGLAMDVVQKQGDDVAFVNHMDEVTAPKIEAYIRQKDEEYGLISPN